MWVELVRSNRTDQLNPHLRSIFLSRDQPNPYNPPTKHGSMWVEPVPTHFDPPTKHTLTQRRIGRLPTGFIISNHPWSCCHWPTMLNPDMAN